MSRLIKAIALLAALGAILGASAWAYGGYDVIVWSWCLIALGVAGLFYIAAMPRRLHAPAIDRPVVIWTVLLFGYVLLQLSPLPLPLLNILSPTRAELTRAFDTITPQWAAPISVMPALTFEYLLRMLAFILMYLLVREAAWGLGERSWWAAAPLLALGVLEAWVGLSQVYAKPPASLALGTYINRDLYGGLFEMLVPFAVMLLPLSMSRGWGSFRTPGSILRIVGSAALVELLLMTMAHTLSRMAIVASIFGIAFAAGVYATRRVSGRLRLAAVTVVFFFAIGIWATAPRALVSRYVYLTVPGQLDAGRMPIWKENLQLIKVYPLTGCGLGCRRSAYLAYKTHQPLYSIDYGHSDYMQALIELGIPGFLIALGAAGSIFREVFRAARTRNNRAATYLALASLGAMAAMALHAFVDFNLHQPSNMLTLAWVAGLGSATSVAPAHREHTDRPVIDLVRID